MLKSYQSIYVTFYRWIFKNFGQGKLPIFKSLFNVSFLLIILLTTVLLLTQLMLKTGMLTVNIYTITAIMLGALFFVFLNHLIFLNNKWLKNLNMQMARLSRHNLNAWSVVILVNVIVVCAFLIFTMR
ncbi:MAG TPA: hypothetical protein VHB54_21920 [Mucilaginibacter sp.]|nr:hypothetical protein [Mucilaginibacter sp.]HVW16505.1 hypothetical protein [Mucilaginibacter sp.]